MLTPPRWLASGYLLYDYALVLPDVVAMATGLALLFVTLRSTYG